MLSTKGCDREVIFIILLAAIVVFLIWGIGDTIKIYENVFSYQSAAYEAASAETMLSKLTALRENMESFGMTSGYGALLFPMETNNMERVYAEVLENERRAREALAISQTEGQTFAYDTKLSETREAIGKLSIPAIRWWFRYKVPTLTIIFVICVVWACGILFTS